MFDVEHLSPFPTMIYTRSSAAPRTWSRVRRAAALLAVSSAALLSGCGDSPTSPATKRLAPGARAADLAPPGTLGVLILDASVYGGASSREAQAAIAAGQPVTVVNGTQWDAMTAGQFSQYRALILGDPYCSFGYLGAAIANRNTWGPVVNGNVFIIGTDPVYHAGSHAGAAQVITSGVKFAVDAEGATGAYITLSCDPGLVSVLQGLSTVGSFATGPAPCGATVDKVADHPALSALTASSLSGWGCSVHETFTSWPSDFDVLAIALDGGGTYTAPDGNHGTPYVLARGKGLVVVSDIQLTPATDNKVINGTEAITATVKSNNVAVSGTTVTFTVVDGPNAGKTATATTDASGVATFSYSSTVEGTDGVRASFVDALGRTQSSNRAAITWAKPADATPPTITHTISGTPSASGWYSSDVTVTFTATDAESAVTTTGCDAQTVTATTPAAGVTYICSATSAGGTKADTVTVKLDKTVPTVTGAVVTGTLGANGWYTSDVGISWTPSTPGPSGQTPSSDCANVTLTTDTPSHTFTCTVTTGAGISSAQGQVTVKRDAQRPQISYQLTGTLGNNFWYVSNVGVVWTTTAGPSGVNSCSSAPVTVDGTNITFACTATAGNGLSRTVTTTSVQRDATRPVVTYSGNASAYTVDQTVNIACTPTDNLSGVASSSCAPITGDGYTFALGTNSYSANATDNAGNMSLTATASFTVSVTQGSLCALAERWTSNSGVANSLCVKLQQGSYQAFRNEVSAQSGKKIPADQAAILLRLVNAL